MCMYDFQTVREVYCLRYGLNEDGSNPERMSIDELNILKQKVQSRMSK